MSEKKSIILSLCGIFILATALMYLMLNKDLSSEDNSTQKLEKNNIENNPGAIVEIEVNK